MSAPQSKQSKPQAAKATPATKEAAPAKAAPAAKAAAPAAAKTAAPAAAKPAAKKAEVTEEHTGGLFDAYDGEPQGAARKASKKPAAAASPVAAGASATEEKSVAFQFSVPNDKVEGKTNPQIKASLNTAFFGWGVIDEIRLVNKEDEKEVTVFLHRPLGKAVAARTAIEKGETSNFNFAGVEAPLSIHEGSSSGGGRSTKTAAGEKKKGADSERGGRGGSRGGRGGRGGASGGSGCFNCGEDGHRAADCPTAGAGGSRGGRGGARGGARGGRGGHSE